MQIVKTETTLTALGKRCSQEYQSVMISKAAWALPHRWVSPEDGEEVPSLVYRAEGTSLKEWIGSRPSADETGEIVDALLHLTEELDRYLLDEEKLCFDPDWIRITPEYDGPAKLQVVYFPFEDVPREEEGFFKQTARYLWEESARDRWEDLQAIAQLHRFAKMVFAREAEANKQQPLLGNPSMEEAAAIVREFEVSKQKAEDEEAQVPEQVSTKPTQEERMAQLAVIAEPFKEDSFWEKWLRLIRFLREKNPIRLR